MGMVLLQFRPQEYCLKMTESPEAAETVYANLFCGNEWVQVDGGELTEEECVSLVGKRIPQYEKCLKPIMANWTECLSEMPGMEELVKRLKNHKNYSLFLLSNTSLRFYEFSKNYKVFEYFDGKIISAAEKMLKPDPEIYHLLCSRYQLKPEECLFIDDVSGNIHAAEKCGLHAHRFQGAEELKTFLAEAGILNLRE